MAVDLEISVIVPTRGRANLLDGALDSLVHQTLDPRLFEIVVVDDGSTDHTADLVEAYRVSRLLPEFVHVSNAGSGLNAARNTGLRRSRAPVAYFLDDDELAPDDHLARVLEHLRTAPDMPGVGGPYVDYGDSHVRTCGACDLGSASLPIPGVGHSGRLLGGNMAIRRVVVEEVGEFDDDLSGRGDETEWFQRANRTFLYDASLFVWHRRAPFGLATLARIQFEQGKAIPTVAAKLGERWRPSPRRLTRYAAHALLRGCGRGVILSARELGACTTWMRTRKHHAALR